MSDCITVLIMAVIIACFLGDDNRNNCRRNRRNSICDHGESSCGSCGR